MVSQILLWTQINSSQKSLLANSLFVWLYGKIALELKIVIDTEKKEWYHKK